MKKYTIAQNEEELDNNLKYISGKITAEIKKDKKNKSINKKKSKQSKSSCKKNIILMKSFYDYNEKLCQMYLNEIALFYLINSFNRKDLVIRKCYLIKKHERYIGVLIPIMLSIIASVVYSIVFKDFLSSFLKDAFLIISNSSVKIFKLFLLNIDVVIHNLVDVLSIVLILIIIVVVIGIFLLFVLGTVMLFLNIIASFIGGYDFSKVVAKQYELEYINEIISCDMYFVLMETLKLLSREFKLNINQLVNNSVILNKSISVEDFEKEVEEKFMNNPHINALINNDMLKMWDKKIIIKSIIFRAILENNGNKSSKWEFSKGMLSIK